mmetsp:Transcript_103575/g.259755  ORF Transcript_103575/g.259755 Transcript_103575/m.259755 type:complete len:784 (-) Transcript_103575:114-2465(-)
MPADLEAPLLKKAPEPFKVSIVPPRSVLLNPFAWLLWILDVLIWLITIIGPIKWVSGCCCRRKPSVQVADDAWRDAIARNAMTTSPFPEAKTAYDIVMKAFTKFADRKALGTRTYRGTEKPEWSKFPVQKFGKTTWVTYRELGQRVSAFGSGLRSFGLSPAPAGADLQALQNHPHAMLIFEDTSAPWLTACLGAFTQNIAVATSYSTLGISSVADAISETGASAIVCNIKDVEKIATTCSATRCPSLKVIIYTTNNSLEKKPKSVPTSHSIVSFEEVIERGMKSPVAASPPDAESLAVIMYTSGSTGKPKGVMIKHKNLTASVGGVMAKFRMCGLKDGQETYLAYLPAAHILEMTAEMSMLCMGAEIGFADPRTISSKGACRECDDGSVNFKPGYPNPPGAIQEFSPSAMAAVPKIWDILKKGAEEQVGKTSGVKKFLFQVAYSGRHFALAQGRDSPLFKALVFKTLSSMMGGRLKIGCSGGGPISADVQTFIRTAFSIPLIQGYGLTETVCAGTMQEVWDVRTGVVGPPISSVEIKLRSCLDEKNEPEILDRKMKPYLVQDTLHYGTPCKGRGEVLIRGPSVSAGYFKQPSKTQEVFDDKQWFHTGDVGLFTPEGSLMIVDRVKNLVKLKGGEYIAIEAMESAYNTSVYTNGMNGGLMCYGDGDMDRPVALVQANTHELEKWAKEQGLQYSSVEALCRTPEAEKLVLDAMVKIGKASGLGANEILCGLALIPGTGATTGDLTIDSPWTPENGGLTASNKLNRQPIQVGCSKILDPLRKKAAR